MLLTAVVVGIVMTPAWLLPRAVAVPWMIAGALFAPPALWVAGTSTPWVPTPAIELDRVLRALDLQRSERFLDLGAGDGRLVVRIHAATGADCVGIELSPFHWLLARLRLLFQGGPGVRVLWGDWYGLDLSGFDAIYVWGTSYSVSTPAFAAFLRRTGKPGARVVSYDHPLHAWEPEAVIPGEVRPLRVYRLPEAPTPTG